MGVSGNVALNNALTVSGSTSLQGTTCTSLADSGNATISGTLGVTGASTFNGNVAIMKAFGVPCSGGAFPYTDTMTIETIVYRPSGNHNTQILPTGANKYAGRTIWINMTGGATITTSDGSSIYVPVNNSSGSSFQLASNRLYCVFWEGGTWVVI